MRHYDPRAVACRTAWVGVAATALYLVAVALGRLHAGALLYDGVVPLPPYRWISPPPDLAADSHRPASGTGSIKLGALEAMPGDASTGDEQAAITFAEGAVAMRPGEPAVNVRLAPLDPRTVAPAPRGLRFDGNAYRITARYATSGRPAALVKPVTVVLRFPVHATMLLRAAPAGWVRLRTTRFAASEQVVADTDRFGIFVAAAPAGIAAAWWWTWAVTFTAAAAVVLAVAVIRVVCRGQAGS